MSNLSLQESPFVCWVCDAPAAYVDIHDLRAAWLEQRLETHGSLHDLWAAGSGSSHLRSVLLQAVLPPSMLLQATDTISPKSTQCSLQAVGASDRVFQLLDRAPQMVPAGKAKPCGDPDGGEVQFCNVHFSYPSRPDVQARSLICAGVCHVGQRGVPWGRQVKLRAGLDAGAVPKHSLCCCTRLS